MKKIFLTVFVLSVFTNLHGMEVKDKLVKLKNGTEASEATCFAINLTLTELFSDDPASFCALVMKCRDPKQKILQSSENALKLLGFTFPIKSPVRDIIVCSVDGKGLDMYIVLPFAPKDSGK